MAQKSTSKRAIESREWRLHNRDKRRFNTLLRGYIEVKYDNIFSEYTHFFNSLNQTNPQARDLTKTKEYKNWKKEQQTGQQASEYRHEDLPCETDEQENDITTTEQSGQSSEYRDEDLPGEADEQENDITTTEQSGQSSEYRDEDLPGEADEQENDLTTTEQPGQSSEYWVEPDTLSTVFDEILPVDVVNVSEAENIIDEIINDLEQDGIIQDLLNEYQVNAMNDQLVQPQYLDEDEGIGLNLETEDIIEPFNYEMEVEPFDF